MRGSAMRESVTDVRIILECLQEAYQMEGDMVYGTVREKYSCDYDISICPYAARKV